MKLRGRALLVQLALLAVAVMVSWVVSVFDSTVQLVVVTAAIPITGVLVVLSYQTMRAQLRAGAGESADRNRPRDAGTSLRAVIVGVVLEAIGIALIVVSVLAGGAGQNLLLVPGLTLVASGTIVLALLLWRRMRFTRGMDVDVQADRSLDHRESELHTPGAVSEPSSQRDRHRATSPTRYPAAPRIVGDEAFGMRCSYVVPVAAGDVAALIRRAVLGTPRLVLTDLTDQAAHIGHRALFGVGYEWIVLTFHAVDDAHTQIDAIARGPFGTVSAVPQHLPALFDAILSELGAPDST